MAQKVAAATGLWSAAATWNSVTNTPTLHASANVAIDATARFTATFTAPNTINACTGVLLFINAKGTGGTVTVTLQESGVDTAAAVTLNIVDLVALTRVYFRFPTPYVFTTTGAGAYRFKVQATTPAGTTNAAADSGGSLYFFWATDDRTGVPATTDSAEICGHNQVTPITVTVDGSQTITGTDTVLAVQRTLGNAVITENLGVLAWDTTADATLTCAGNFICNNGGGELQVATAASPMPAARVARLRFDMAVSGNHGLRVFDTGKLTTQGRPLTYYKTKYVSGVGTAADPAILADPVDWSVGDEVAISATSDNATNYNETEYRFIIIKNSPTSYVWSATSGGAEAALTYTHTADAWVLNIQRNVIIDSTDSSRAYYVYINTATAGNVDCDWTLFDVLGTTISDKEGFKAEQGTDTLALDYSVFTRYANGLFLANVNTTLAFTGLIFTNQRAGSAAAPVQIQSSNNKTMTDCFILNTLRTGFNISSYNITLTRCYAIACNTAGGTNNAGFIFASAGAVVMDDCEVHATRFTGINLAGVSDLLASGVLAGTKGVNTVDVFTLSLTYNTAVFIDSTFGSAIFVSNYLNMLVGSSVQFHAYNGNPNNHTWYTPTGYNRSTGAGLVDTTTRTVGALALRLAAQSADGVVWEFLIGTAANSAASVFGFLDANAAFQADGAATCTVELFLPSSTVADESVIFPTDIPWEAAGSFGNVFNLAANYTGSVAAFARVRITARTTTSSAYVYVADLYNGTNVLTSFKAWNDGKPAPVFTELLGDAAAVWAILEGTQTTVGTMGYEILTDLTTLRTDVFDLQTRVPATLDGGNMRSSVLNIDGAAIDDLLDDADSIEIGLTLRQALRLTVAAAAAKLSGAATAQVTIRNAVADSKNRIIADVDANGNRTNVVYDLTD